MGTWGTGLYSNDSACDIRGDYIDKLKRGKTNDEATQELINSNRDIMGDVEEEPLFWFALADTQWNYGRLLPKVKEKALYFLSQDKELQRWKESGERQLTSWIKTLDTLKEKLESPQPPEKKVYKYRLYRCKWHLGDVYAYRFSLDLSPEESPDGILLISESDKAIPKDNLMFLGNLPGNDLIPFRGHDYWLNYIPVGWETSKYNEKFEHYVIDMYLACCNNK